MTSNMLNVWGIILLFWNNNEVKINRMVNFTCQESKRQPQIYSLCDVSAETCLSNRKNVI